LFLLAPPFTDSQFDISQKASGKSMRILLVEDDRMIGEAMLQALKDASYAVDWVRDGQAALTAAGSQHYDAMLLDLGLPQKDGLAVIQSLRAGGNATPVLIVTARDAVEDRIQGLDRGADDYILKPFIMTELLARIRAVVRRKAGVAGPLFTNGTLSLNPVTREAILEGVATRLSAREFSLLQALLLRPGAILSRTQLEGHIYGWNEEVESNAVEFLIHSLRKKFGSAIIKNVRGLGWMVSQQK
jgi:two-component system OmpR family response regulator